MFGAEENLMIGRGTLILFLPPPFPLTLSIRILENVKIKGKLLQKDLLFIFIMLTFV